MTDDKNTVDLAAGSIRPLILRLSVPPSIGFAILFLFQLVDLFWVSRLGADALAAFAFTLPITLLILSLTMGLGLGVTAVVARAIGAGESEAAPRLGSHSLVLALACGACLTLLGLELNQHIFTLLGAPRELIGTIAGYMRVWFCGYPLLIMGHACCSTIRATSDTRTPTLVSIAAGLLSIGIGPLLIFGIGPFPRLGLSGAAAANVFSWGVSLAAIVVIMRRRGLIELTHLWGINRWLASWR